MKKIMIGLPLCLMLAYCSTTKTSNDDTANSGTGNTTEMSGSATVGTDVSNSSTSTDMTTSSGTSNSTSSATGTTDSSSMSDVSMDANPEVALKNQSAVNNQLSTGTPYKSSGYNYQSNYSVNNPWTPRKSVYEVTVDPDNSPLYGEWSLELTPEVAAIWRLDTASWNNYYAGVRPMNDWLFPNGSYMSGSATVTPYNNADMNVRSDINANSNLSSGKTLNNSSAKQNNLSGSVNASGSVNTNSNSVTGSGSVKGNTSSPTLNNSANPSSMGANNTAGVNNSATGSNSALRPGAAQTPPSPYANDFRDSSAATTATSSATNNTLNNSSSVNSNTTSGISKSLDSSANYSSNNGNYVSGSATSGYNNNLQGAALLTYTDASGATRTWNNQYFIAANGNIYQMPKFNLYIENGSFTGYTGCNNISGRIHIDSTTNAIHFENTTPATAIDCVGGLNEAAFLDMLRSIDSYEIMNNQLILKQGTKTVLSFSKKGNGGNMMMHQDTQTPGTNMNSTETDNNRLMNNNNSTNGSTTTDEKNGNQPK